MRERESENDRKRDREREGERGRERRGEKERERERESERENRERETDLVENDDPAVFERAALLLHQVTQPPRRRNYHLPPRLPRRSLSHISFRKSTHPQNRQLIVLIGDTKQKFDGFSMELTFGNHLINCIM